MIRKKIREFLLSEMKKDFPHWDFSLNQEIVPPTNQVKVNFFFPEEKFSVFADGPRVFESHLTSEIELAMAFEKEKPAMERELAQVMWWLEKNRFMNQLVLNSQIDQVETWEDYNGDRPLAFCRISFRCMTHQNLLEAS